MTQKKAGLKKSALEGTFSLILAVALVFMVRSSVIEAFKIPSGSMIPTLLVGDHIFVNKFAYGLKVPFTEWFLEKPVFVFRREPPKRGDIIVFLYPGSPPGETVYYIKRVVGVPGDVIEVRNKAVYINNTALEMAPLPDDKTKRVLVDVDNRGFHKDYLRLFQETLGTRSHIAMWDTTTQHALEFGPVTVPEDKFFVMGDNRDHSNDSRYWGFVPLDNIKGRAMFIWLSAWIDFGTNEFTFKPSRIGTVLN